MAIKKIILSENQYTNIISESIQTVSLQVAKDDNLIYPVYHGTSGESYKNIIQGGFKIPTGEKDLIKKNSYLLKDYWNGIPAPTDHLGFGVYFTTVKSIAKKFNDNAVWDSKRFLPEYALKINNLETINFGSNKNMMKWWIENGYDVELARRALKENDYKLRDEATAKMTETLKSKFDAVFFKGKGLNTLLDGNQICVYDTANIFLIDKKNIKKGEIGSNVILKDGRKGKLIDLRDMGSGYLEFISNPENYKNQKPEFQLNVEKHLKSNKKFYTVKLTKGGTLHNLLNTDFEYL